MQFPLSYTLALGTAFTATTALHSSRNNDTTDIYTPNANHIFNAIHATMSHQQSALHPNGMSFYLATVPKGAKFYHGTSSPDPIIGVEWLAFEVEHALGFAHRSELRRRPRPLLSSDTQLILTENGESEHVAKTAGYLHTYTAAKDLRLLYLDGMSGNKGPSGTLDAQDRILFNDSIGRSFSSLSRNGGIGGPPDDQQRALLACKMAEELWNGRIDGLIRTEADFEIILCRFERVLEVVHITRTKPQTPAARKTAGHSRFNDLAGRQVKIDFERFVTAYAYDLDLFPGDAKLPRLSHLSSEELESIRQDLNEMILDHDFDGSQAPDWRNVVGMITGRYSAIIHSIASGKQRFNSIDEIRSELESLLEPFIDYRHADDKEAIVYRCREHYIPKSAGNDTLVINAVRTVSSRICESMVEVLLDEEYALDRVVDLFRSLGLYLGWPWEDILPN